ncbi:hypothetical protein OIU74_022839 [Salix koriyanagi]|uniref:Uncharacterized protein n=1 Tax=Salix koriyanagi TaxID=2511006 RepID=A0A9Q0WL70_9ROSI|nr:hypothetical protein OIU74_022839 [Salix koriyanagi]
MCLPLALTLPHGPNSYRCFSLSPSLNHHSSEPHHNASPSLPHGTNTLPQPSLHGVATPQPFSLSHLPSDPSLLTLKSDHHTPSLLTLSITEFPRVAAAELEELWLLS